MTSAAFGVSLRGFPDDDKTFTFNVASTIVIGDVGKPVSLDTSAANKVKLAVSDDAILGTLVSFEDRTVEGLKVGAVQMGYTAEWTVDPAAATDSPPTTPVVGDFLQGATYSGAGGYVKTSATATSWRVVEVRDSGATVVAIRI